MKIVVLAGGTSPERDVSLVSGTGVYRALKSKGHQVVLLDVFFGLDATEDEVAHIFEDSRDFAEGIGGVRVDGPDVREVIATRPASPDGFFGPNVLTICKMADIAFLALHGANGEDGRIQATFDLLGIKYTGTDYVSSTLAMDKALTKDILVRHGIKTPQGFGLTFGQDIPEIRYPVVVKTSHGGSSVGVYFVEKEEELRAALDDAFTYEDEVVIEEMITGKEYTDVVIDGKALPIVAITPKVGRYDYKNKYQAGSTEEICPAPISAELTDRIKRMAEEVYAALRLQVYARMDFIVDAEENIYCLEANTLPGMTPTSLIPQEAAAVGIDYEALCEWLVNLSLGKYKGSET